MTLQTRWLLLASLAMLACVAEQSAVPPRSLHSFAAEPCPPTETHACIQGPLLQVNVLDPDLDGLPKTVELFKTGFKYPFLARWHVRPGYSPESATWAVATHLLVTHFPDPGKIAVEKRIRLALDRPQVTVRQLALPGAYVVVEESWQPAGDGSASYLLAQAAKVRALEGMQRVSPDYLYFSLTANTPDDPDFLLKQKPLQDIGALKAWEVTTGCKRVKVAVLDTGIDTGHSDLIKNIALRPDGSILGKDFHNNMPVPKDDNFHGTYCAGILGAEGNNGKGIAGVNWQVSIVPVKVLDKDACGTTENIVNGIKFAIGEGGATILSNSWGGAPYSQELEKAVQRAADQHVLFVAGAGNDNVDLDSTPFYPASLPEPNVISVGGVDGNNPQMCWGHGSKRVHLSAPGVGIRSTVLKPLFFNALDGTSASTAFVAGACALLESTGLHYLDIRTRLLQSSVDTGVQGASCSRGRLDLANAVLGAPLRTDFQCP